MYLCLLISGLLKAYVNSRGDLAFGQSRLYQMGSFCLSVVLLSYAEADIH